MSSLICNSKDSLPLSLPASVVVQILQPAVLRMAFVVLLILVTALVLVSVAVKLVTILVVELLPVLVAVLLPELITVLVPLTVLVLVMVPVLVTRPVLIASLRRGGKPMFRDPLNVRRRKPVMLAFLRIFLLFK